MWLWCGSTIERTQPCSDLHSASLRRADCAAIGGGSSSAADIMNGILVLMSPATAERWASSAGSVPKYAIRPSLRSSLVVKSYPPEDRMAPARPDPLGPWNSGCD